MKAEEAIPASLPFFAPSLLLREGVGARKAKNFLCWKHQFATNETKWSANSFRTSQSTQIGTKITVFLPSEINTNG